MLRAKVVRIGNSQGIQIPKPLLQQAGLRSNVKLRVEKGRLLVIPDDKPRAGWAEAFAQAVRHGKSGRRERVDSFPSDFDEKEWT